MIDYDYDHNHNMYVLAVQIANLLHPEDYSSVWAVWAADYRCRICGKNVGRDAMDHDVYIKHRDAHVEEYRHFLPFA